MQDGDGGDLDWARDLAALMEKWPQFANVQSARKWPKVVCYSFCLLDKGHYDEIGRMLQADVARDGTRGSGKQAETRRRDRRASASTAGSSSLGSMDDSDFHNMMDLQGQREQQTAALGHLLQNGLSDEVKMRAQSALMKTAFPQAPNRKRGRRGSSGDDDDEEDED